MVDSITKADLRAMAGYEHDGSVKLCSSAAQGFPNALCRLLAFLHWQLDLQRYGVQICHRYKPVSAWCKLYTQKMVKRHERQMSFVASGLVAAMTWSAAALCPFARWLQGRVPVWLPSMLMSILVCTGYLSSLCTPNEH